METDKKHGKKSPKPCGFTSQQSHILHSLHHPLSIAAHRTELKQDFNAVRVQHDADARLVPRARE